MLAEARNLLAENDIYRRYEFTFLRQLVIIIREVTSNQTILEYLLGVFAISSYGPVAENPTSCLLLDKWTKIL